MTSLASQIQFSKLCSIFEDVSSTRGNKKVEIISKFFEKCRKRGEQLKLQDPNADTSMFPIVRLFLLKNDRERGPNGLKERALALLYVRIFCLGKNSTNAKKLINYREPMKSVNTNDFAERVYWVLKSRLNKSSSLSLEQVNQYLDKISEKFAANEKQDSEFIKLTEDCSATELKWLTRIILKDAKLALGSNRVLEAYHPDAARLFSEKSNLRYVCETLQDPKKRINTKICNINILSPFKPMLLERLPITHIRKFFVDSTKTEFIIQTKFDGERSQLHMKDGVFRYFTRHGLDITNNPSYGESAENGGFLTKKIASLLNPNCHSIILDGELMGWHKDYRKFSTKGVAFDVKKLTFKSKHQPCLIVFDILLYNDDLLVNTPLDRRLQILEEAFQESEGVLLRSKNERVNSTDEIIAAFNKSLDNHEEGIVLKKCDSLYRVDTREGSGCYKIKSEYSEGLIQDVDLVVVGAHYGEGKFSGLFNSFLMAVAVPSDASQKFYSVVSVGTGLSIEHIRDLNAKFESFWSRTRPDAVVGPRRGGPDVWIHPKNSVVLELRATEMLQCNNHPSGLTLRFPRILKIRDDKPWHDACTLTELKSLVHRRGVVQKLTKRHATADDIWEIPTKVSRERSSTIRVDDRYLGVRAFEVTKVSRVLQGREICVINGEEKLKKENKLTKNEIEKIVLQHSGKIVQHPRSATFCIIIGNAAGLKATNVIQSCKYDVVKLSWLLRATKEENWGALEDWCPWEILSFKETTLERFKEAYDDYYDSYTQDADEESLRRSLKRISTLKDTEGIQLSPRKIRKMEAQLFDNLPSPFSLFRDHIGYFTDPDDLRRFEFKCMRGEISENIDDNVTVFVGDEPINVIELYEKINQNDKTGIVVVKSRWIHDCFKARKLIGKNEYIVI